MNKIIDLKYAITGLAIAGVVAFIFTLFIEIPFWLVFGVVVFSMVVNGVIAEYEDNRPGGFNNPMSTEEIEAENKKRKRKLRPLRIAVWCIFIVLLMWLTWIYHNKSI